MRQLIAAGAAVVLLAGACSSGGSGTAVDETNPSGPGTDQAPPATVVLDLDGGELQLVSSLQTFGACDALLEHIVTEASERVGAYGVEGDGRFWGGDVVELAAEDDARDTATDASGDLDSVEASATVDVEQAVAQDGALVEGEDFSGTNLQEVGVDEADIVKTDGRRIVVVSGSSLVVVEAASGNELGRVEIGPGWNREMFLSGDDILMISNDDSGMENGLFADDVVEPGGSYVARTLIQQIRLVDDRPEIVETLRAEGDYVSARAVGGTARIVVRSNPIWNLPFVYPRSPAGEERAAESNREMVLATTLDDWLPSFERVDANGETTAGQLVPCERVHSPTTFAGFGSLSVLSVPLGGALDPSTTTSVMAPGNIVYASPDSLFVATQTWFDTWLFDTEADWESAWEQRQTSIHRFDLAEPIARYAASGSVPGDVRDQFSFSEFDGHLRVVTTSGDAWSETSESFVRVLRETDGELVEVGSVGNLGNGEAVQSVRFVGDMGYVVTFRQIDPFYTVDLSDPTAPRVVGELKIPGFSSYLHPLGDGMVLGVGSSADEENGRVTGAKVSLFDASDPAAPQEIAVWEAPDGWNDVGWEHRAFLWWAPEQLAVIPVQIWSEGWAGAVVLRVADGQITEVGRIDHDTGEAPPAPTCDEITAESLGVEGDPEQAQSELEWILYSGDGRLFACGDGETVELDGFECYNESWFREDAEATGIELPDGDLTICWPGASLEPIVRSIVIGDELFTLSYRWGDAGQTGSLHSHDLDTLTRRLDITL